MRAARDARAPALAVLSDIRTGLPGGADERDGGDGAAAFLFADDAPDARVLAEPLGAASATAEFLDRWRLPGEPASRQWEERFGEHAYVPLGEAALVEALKHAGVTAPAITRLIVAGPHGRAVKRVAAAAGVKKEAIADDLLAIVGNAGAAHAGLMFADALDRAQADDLIAVVSLADGADVSVWRVTAATHRPAGVAAQVAGGARVAYPTFLTWRGFLRREPPRRPDPQAPEAPPVPPGRGVEVRVHRQPLPGVRHPSPAAPARVREVPRRRPHGPRADGRRAGHDRHVHGRPPGLLALAADGGGRARLRGRRPLPVRDDRRRSQVVKIGDRVDDDVPPPDHRRRRPQLLLESQAAPRLTRTADG